MEKEMREKKMRNEPPMLKIELNSEFYNIDAVNESLDDFGLKDVSSVLKDKKKIIVSMPENKDVPMLKEEFCNYVLGMMKNKMLV